MKISIFAHNEHDYIAAATYCGLISLFGNTVSDYMGYAIHAISNSGFLPWKFVERMPSRELPVDLAFVFDSWIRFNDGWDRILRHLHLAIRPFTIFVVGNDPDDPVELPLFPIDIIFQREINCSLSYPYDPKPLQMSLPEAEVAPFNTSASIDVFFCGNQSHSIRKSCARAIATSDLKFITGIDAKIKWSEYKRLLRDSKFAICPFGSSGCHDCMRNWEAAFNGAVPVFVGWGQRKLVPHFFEDGIDAIFAESPEAAVEKIRQFSRDGSWIEMRRRCLEKVAKHHTIISRIEWILSHVPHDG